MTIEIVEFKCPTCGHLLGEGEYNHACELMSTKLDEKLEGFKIEYAKRMQIELNAKFSNCLNEKLGEINLKHKKEIAMKDKQIEAVKLQASAIEERKTQELLAEREAQSRQKEEEYKLQLKRIGEHNKELITRADKLQDTLNNIPPELRGTASEFILVEELKKEFPIDVIIPKKPGVSMADAIQTIVCESGQKLSTPIIYDRKLGDTITRLDIEKAISYKIIHKTDYCLMVTERGIPGNRLTHEKEGILLVHPKAVIVVAKLIRTFILESSKRTRNNVARESKQSRLYDYVTSQDYARVLKTAINMKTNLDDLQRKEEDYHKVMWYKRKRSIDSWFKSEEQSQHFIDNLIQGDDNG